MNVSNLRNVRVGSSRPAPGEKMVGDFFFRTEKKNRLRIVNRVYELKQLKLDF